MAEYAAQSISHAIVAAAVAAALVRVWRITEPGLRLAFRLLPLVYPLVVLPAFLVLAPVRDTEAFRAHWALFAGERWAALGPAGLPVGDAVFALLAALGAGVFLRDAWLLVRRAGDGARFALPVADAAALAREVEEAAGRLSVPAPGLCVVDTAEPVLLVVGVRRPRLIVSRGALARLEGRERRAALAHEMAHLARRDPLLGWVLMGCRLAAFFNPAVQLVSRAAVREQEWRADDLAVRATGDAPALASALTALAGSADGPRPRTGAGARAETIRARRRRLVAPRPVRPTTLGPLRLGLAGSAIAALLFFVV